MSLIEIIFIGIALSIDVFVVSFAHGLALPEKKIKNAFLLAVFTSVAQGMMPLIGYFCTQPVYKYVSTSSKYIVFAIFMYLGIKFIKEAFDNEKEVIVCLTLSCLLMIAFATSIDALGAGFSLRFYQVSIIISSEVLLLSQSVDT